MSRIHNFYVSYEKIVFYLLFFSFIFYDIFRNYENAISQCLYGSGSYFTLDDHFNKLIHFLEGIVYLTDETSLKTTQKMQQDTLFYEQAFQKIDQAIENLGERIIPTEIFRGNDTNLSFGRRKTRCCIFSTCQLASSFSSYET